MPFFVVKWRIKLHCFLCYKFAQVFFLLKTTNWIFLKQENPCYFCKIFYLTFVTWCIESIYLSNIGLSPYMCSQFYHYILTFMYNLNIFPMIRFLWCLKIVYKNVPHVLSLSIQHTFLQHCLWCSHIITNSTIIYLLLFFNFFFPCYMGRLTGKASRNLFSMVKWYYQYNHKGSFKIFCENSKDFYNLIEFTLSSIDEQLCKAMWICFEAQIENNHVHATYCKYHMWSWCVTLITHVESLIKKLFQGKYRLVKVNNWYLH